MVGIASPNRLHLQVFTTSWRLNPPRVYWPFFMPDPLMGFPLQSFTPPAQPYTVSDTAPLLPLDIHRFPFDSTLLPYFPVQGLSSTSKGSLQARVYTPSSGFSSTRESVTHPGGLDQYEHIALLSLRPLQGFPPRFKRHDLHHASPPVVHKKVKAPLRPTPGSSLEARSACLFQDCLPSWGFSPYDTPQLFDLAPARESPPQGLGFVTVPLSTHL